MKFLIRDENGNPAGYANVALLMKYYGPCTVCERDASLLYGAWINQEADGEPDVILCQAHLWAKGDKQIYV